MFKYDSDGIRARKEYASIYVDYITDGTKILCENRYGVNFRSYYYDASGSPIGLSHGGDIYSFKKNSQGDIIGIYDELGFLVVEYTYDPYGNVLSQTGSEAQTVGNANPFLYRGYYFDRDLGWYYLNSRYYDPVVGRFINVDAHVSTGHGIIGNNMFNYCLNNPINMIDVEGEEPEYIQEQRADTMVEGKRMADIPFGLGNVDDNGCGAIAVYNVFQSVEFEVKLTEIITVIYHFGGLILLGYFGCTPHCLYGMLSVVFNYTCMIPIYSFITETIVSIADAIIVMVKWEGLKGLHYIAGIKQNDDKIAFYNSSIYDKDGNEIDGTPITFDEFLEYVELKNATPLLLIAAREKKG